jgi:hypothetical protein
MILVIIANSFVLALYDYSDRDAKNKLNTMFGLIFLLEALMKIVAYGFIVAEDSYLRYGWNIIDATVVIAG